MCKWNVIQNHEIGPSELQLQSQFQYYKIANKKDTLDKVSAGSHQFTLVCWFTGLLIPQYNSLAVCWITSLDSTGSLACILIKINQIQLPQLKSRWLSLDYACMLHQKCFLFLHNNYSLHLQSRSTYIIIPFIEICPFQVSRNPCTFRVYNYVYRIISLETRPFVY